MAKRDNRLNIGVVWFGIFIALAAVSAIALSLNQTAIKESEKAFVNNLKFLSESSAKSVQLFFDGLISEMILLTEIDAVKKYKSEQVDIAFRGMIVKHGETISNLVLVGANGVARTMLTKKDRPEPDSEIISNFYKSAITRWRVTVDEETFTTGVNNDIAIGMPIFRRYEKGTKDEKQSPSAIYASGMTLALVSVKGMVGEFVDLSEKYKDSYSWLVTDSGKILADDDSLAKLAKVIYPAGDKDFASLADDISKLKSGQHVKGLRFVGADKKSIRVDTESGVWYIATANLDMVDHEWTMVLAVPESAATRLIDESFTQTVTLFLIVVALLIAGGALMTKVSTRMVRAEEQAILAEELSKKNKSLADLNKRLDEFVSVVSHDIKSPLSVIRGLVRMIQSDPDGAEKFSRETDTMMRSCNRLTQLVNDILDVSKLEDGKMRLAPDPLVIDDLISESVMTMEHAANEKNQTIEMILGDKTDMKGDVSKLLQVLNNLLANAIKFSPNGGKIRVTKQVENSDVKVTVSDTGPGIPEESKYSVFDKYEQLKSHRQGFEPGSGLGLAICKGVVELHGGSINVESSPGEGSAFTITLPLKPVNN